MLNHRPTRRLERAILLALLVAAAPGRVCADANDILTIPAGTFVMGDPEGEADEAPREARIDAFRIMRHEVTNGQFAAFVAATGHRTDAESEGAGFVWDGRWRSVSGANWLTPTGAGSTTAGLADHPVVQISARDAEAYCAHHGLRLPTEAEWEYAARGADRRRFPWGDTPPRQGSEPARANFGSEACCAPSGGGRLS